MVIGSWLDRMYYGLIFATCASYFATRDFWSGVILNLFRGGFAA